MLHLETRCCNVLRFDPLQDTRDTRYRYKIHEIQDLTTSGHGGHPCPRISPYTALENPEIWIALCDECLCWYSADLQPILFFFLFLPCTVECLQMLQKKNEEMKVMRETLKGYGWKDPAESA
jgi:hypothetical protein